MQTRTILDDQKDLIMDIWKLFYFIIESCRSLLTRACMQGPAFLSLKVF